MPVQPGTSSDAFERTERRWPDPETGPWTLTLLWTRHGGRLDVAGMQLVPRRRDLAPLTTSLLREVRLAELAAEERIKLPHEPPPRREPAEVLAGMRPATVKRLQRVAEIYTDAWQRGAGPLRAVMEGMNVTHPAAVNLIARARSAGLLPPTSKGVPQG